MTKKDARTLIEIYLNDQLKKKFERGEALRIELPIHDTIVGYTGRPSEYVAQEFIQCLKVAYDL